MDRAGPEPITGAARAAAARLLVLAALCLGTAACAAPRPDCSADADCGASFRCTAEGTCLHVEAGGGSGGTGPAADACESSADCLPEPFAFVPDIYWDGSEAGEPVCTVPLLTCPAGECPVPTECRPILADASRPGLLRCEADTDCWSGRCLQRDGARFCLRSCKTDGDCPYADAALTGGDATGFTCEALVDRGVPLRSCMPVDAGHPARTLCRDDCDCGPPGACTPEAGLACRFLGHNTPKLRAVPVCEPFPRPPGREAGARCRAEPLSCHGGACAWTCEVNGDHPIAFCDVPRCTSPCDRDSDCPERTSCTDGREDERVGGFRHDHGSPGRDVHYCRLPPNGCEDEVDCCPLPDGQGGCLQGWSPGRKRCAVVRSGPPASPRLLTMCSDLDPAKAAPGSCCGAHEECDSALCVPARPGTPCAGGGVCSVPCEPDPDAGTGTDGTEARDRCAEADFAPSLYHQASRCLPFDYELAFVDEEGASHSRLVPLRVCR